MLPAIRIWWAGDPRAASVVIRGPGLGVTLKIAIYNLHFATLGGGERSTCALAVHLAKKHNVAMFVNSPVSIATIKAIFGFDLSNIKIIPLEDRDHTAEIVRFDPDLFINNSHGSKLPNPARRGIYKCMFPDLTRIDLRTYHAVTANSQYTAKWITRRWGCPSEVVYSACQNMGPPLPKAKIILNVARFSDAQFAHHKRQEILLKVFKNLVDGGFRDWQLDFVGTIGPCSEDRAFVDKLANAAAGYPVHIRPDIDFNELRHLYQKSSIYWHATGFGTSEAKQPGLQEHFGMSIVEAMSAGAVPIAFNSGGPREVIDPGINGFLWNTPIELMEATVRLTKDPQLFKSMSEAAVLHSRGFVVDQYLARMDDIIERVMAPDYRPQSLQSHTARLKMTMREIVRPPIGYLKSFARSALRGLGQAQHRVSNSGDRAQ